MVSPSKKRQIKGRVTAGRRSDRKGDKGSSRLYKPLLNKKFYLDVKGYKGIATITADIHNLGGVVEEFFSREVNYVISIRGTPVTGGSSSEQQPSPSGVPTASPLTPHQPLSSIPSTSHDSPLNIDSPREDTGKKRVRTRAEVLLERACVRRQGTSDLLENARLWNVPVWPLAKLLKWLSILKENDQYRPQKTQGAVTSKSSSTSSSPKVRRLRAPFIKTESFTRQYKPLYKELPIWPELNLSSPRGVSPFAEPKQARVHQNPKTSSAHRDEHREKQIKNRNRGAKIKDCGYCELCSINYTSLRLHLQSDSHTAFVRNDKNYLYLDELISGHRQSSQIGETIHSGPTLVVQEELKDEDVAAKSNCVFPGDTQESACVLRESCPQAEIPSTRHCSPQLPAPPCPSGQSQPEPHSWHTHCDVDVEVHLKASLPAALVPEAIVPEIIVPKISDLEATIPHVIGTKTAVPEAPITEAAVPELLLNKAIVPEVILNEATVPEVTLNEPVVPQNKVTETALPEVAGDETAIHKDKLTEFSDLEVIVNEATYKNTTETAVPQANCNSVFLKDKVNEGVIHKEKLNDISLPKDKANDAAIPTVIVNESITNNIKREKLIPKLNVNETTAAGIPSTEAILLEVTNSETVLPKVFEIKPVVTEVTEAIGTEHTTSASNLPLSVAAVLGDLPLGAEPAHPQASLPVATKENREMVRLIQEADAKLDSFCPKRSKRTSKRLISSDFEAVEIKSEPVSRAKRCIRTRKSSCRSDKSESETSDSRSVADESLYFDMVDKTTKRGKPKNGEPILDEAATHISAKYNGDASSELVNGAHKVKGRRISRANSDESDSSSASRSNGNVDHNSEKLDFSLLLEISPADRKKFESKKAKIRRKTADWLLISETEQYYNEKEEIMRNKNKLESDSESDESDDGTENQDSKSDCSDESEGMANPPRGRSKGKCKLSRTVDDDDCKPTAKRIKDDPGINKKRGRPIGSRNRKTRYDLTMLNDDDDDDENFFGFPVSTTIPQTTQSSSTVSSSSTQTRGKGKGGNKPTPDTSSCSGKSGRKRLSDAERFLRDNREYYHFQETPERLRRSTSSSVDKEKATKVDESEGKELDKKEESKLKETLTVKKQSTTEGRRRVTRSTGCTRDDPEAEEGDETKILEKNEAKDVKIDIKSTEKIEVKDKEKDKRKVSVEEKKKASSENKRKISEEDNRKVSEDDKSNSSEDKRKTSEDDVRTVTEDEKRKAAVEDKRKVNEEEKRKITEEKRKVTEEDKKKITEEDKRVTEENKRKDSDEVKRMTSEADRRKSTEEDKKKSLEEEKKRSAEESEKNISGENKVKDNEVGKKRMLEMDKRKTGLDDKISCKQDQVKKQLLNFKTKVASVSESTDNARKENSVDIMEKKDGPSSVLQDLYFSFEGVPVQESWYQTYQRLIDGIDINEFAYEEEPLRFVLPYEMPKEYIRDFLCYKKGMLSKKKNDLADLVRKSPRCHASTLALFSDIIPTKKAKGAKVTKSVPVKIDEASSDGTSTPGAESTRMQQPECFESAEELAILALHIDHFMKSETGIDEIPVCNPLLHELKDSEEPDLKKTPPKKRGKKKRLLGGSKSEKGSESIAKELKLFESPLAREVDPVFIAGLCDEVKDYLTPENILAREASEVIEDSCFCVCTDRASCDEFSSADDNTEASSECVSLCDSETVDGSVVSEPKRSRSGKKRRKNLTGWPKAQKRKRPVPSHTSDDNDSAIGCDDLEPKKQGHWKKHDDFSLLEQTTTQKLAALAACDRRASPRKKTSVLYMDTWPVRYRTQK